MASTISGTTLTYGNGTTQGSGGGRVIQYGYGENNTRTSLSTNNNYIYWGTAAQLQRQRSDSCLRIKAMMPGHEKYSYPYGGTFVEVEDPNGTRFRSYVGSVYEPCRESSNMEIILLVEKTFLAADLNSNTGTWKVHFGYQSNNGSNNRWAAIWNPNNNDDGRAFQKGSTCFVEEIVYGD